MEQLFNINLDKIPISSKKEETNRKKNLEIFLESGFPKKKDENWKFSDLNLIIKKNFKNINNNFDFSSEKKLNSLMKLTTTILLWSMDYTSQVI